MKSAYSIRTGVADAVLEALALAARLEGNSPIGWFSSRRGT
jgi:hypothetical protein